MHLRIKLRKLLLFTAIMLVMAVIITPLVIGHFIKNNYDELIAFYNSQGDVQIETIQYKKHWFSAEAKLSVVMTHPMLRKLSRALNSQGIALPETISFTIDQHIQYGPILYRKTYGKSLAIELAYMYSEINLSSDLAKIVKPINPYEPIVLIIDNLSFDGKFVRNFRSSGMRVIFPTGDDDKLEMRGFDAFVTIWPDKHHVKADIYTGDLLMLNHGLSFSIPTVELICNEWETASGLWVGDNSVALPQVYVRDHDQAEVSVIGVSSRGKLTETNGRLNGSRHFNIDSIQTHEQKIGPFVLDASIHDLDASAVDKLITTYMQMLMSDQNILGTAQLMMILPSVINEKSAIVIDHLQATTPNGDLNFTGDVKWPTISPSEPRTLIDVVRQANAQGLLRVKVPLANNLLQVIADLSYKQQPPTESVSPPDKQKKIIAARHQNELLIDMLIQNHQLTSESGAKLLGLQQKNETLDDYLSTLNNLLVSKQISSSVMQMLRSQYAAVQFISMPVEQQREHAERELQTQVLQWLHEGYILQDQDDYVVALLFQKGVVTINGKTVA